MSEDTQEYIKVLNHGTGPIEINWNSWAFQLAPKELRPTELHFKEDGTKDHQPSFAIVMVDRMGSKFYGQFSLNTLQKALAELGYTLYQP